MIGTESRYRLTVDMMESRVSVTFKLPSFENLSINAPGVKTRTA